MLPNPKGLKLFSKDQLKKEMLSFDYGFIKKNF